MKNPLVKQNNSGLIALVVVGGVVAAGVAWLLLTDDGDELLENLKKQVKEIAKDTVAGVVSKKTGISKKTAKTAANIVAN